jgi:hypothetical protein
VWHLRKAPPTAPPARWSGRPLISLASPWPGPWEPKQTKYLPHFDTFLTWEPMFTTISVPWHIVGLAAFSRPFPLPAEPSCCFHYPANLLWLWKSRQVKRTN